MKHRPSGIKVDAKAIAQGFYNDMFTEKERAIVAFGMLPAEKMETLSKLLGEKFEACAKDQMEAAFDMRPDEPCAKEDMKKDFIRKVSHEISVEIYSYAESIGKMIC
jgi:hypothetical protein